MHKREETTSYSSSKTHGPRSSRTFQDRGAATPCMHPKFSAACAGHAPSIASPSQAAVGWSSPLPVSMSEWPHFIIIMVWAESSLIKETPLVEEGNGSFHRITSKRKRVWLNTSCQSGPHLGIGNCETCLNAVSSPQSPLSQRA